MLPLGLGWVSVFTAWIKSTDLALVLLATKALAHLDQDFSEKKYVDGVYLCHPQHRNWLVRSTEIKGRFSYILCNRVIQRNNIISSEYSVSSSNFKCTNTIPFVVIFILIRLTVFSENVHLVVKVKCNQ